MMKNQLNKLRILLNKMSVVIAMRFLRKNQGQILPIKKDHKN